MTVNINLETITPEIARYLLSKNITNRGLRPATVDEYTKQMRSGEWQITHQGIAINKHGQLIDGQHRLTAVVRSGVTVQMFVARGFDAEDHRGLMVDTGAKRTVSDVYGVDQKLAQVCAFIARVAKRSTRSTYSEVRDFIDEFGGDVAAVTLVKTKHIPVITSASTIAAAAIMRRADIMSGKSGQYAVDSYERLRKFDSQNFTSSEGAFAKAVMSGTIKSTDRVEIFGKALVVFDESCKDMIRIHNSSNRLDAATRFINNIMDKREEG